MTATLTKSSQGMEKLLPQNLEAERGVLGSIIIDPEAITKVADFLNADDFYRDAHRTIYAAIIALTHAQQSADFITLCDELERNNDLENVGGASYITSLINQVPTSGNVEYYARIVERTAFLRRLLHASGEIAAMAYDGSYDIDEATNRAQQLLLEATRNTGNEGVTRLNAELDAYILALEERKANGNRIIGVPTGYKDYDKIVPGLEVDKLYLLAARPGMGKTSYALNVAMYAASQGYKVLFISVEMAVGQLVNKLVSLASGVDSQRLAVGDVYDEEWELILNGYAALCPLPIWLEYAPSATTSHVRTVSQKLMQEEGIDLIIVDYLQLMSSDMKRENRVNEVGALSRDLKILAGELHVPVLALSQLSRDLEKRASKVPQLSDLRDSGELEQNADTVTFIYRDDAYNPESERPNQADLIVAKNRSGPTGEIALYWKAHNQSFHNLEIFAKEENS